ncbi:MULTISPECIES: Rossmann-like domain-containing protein [unclassified Streptomyces]|uniref:Rossmann-like domain-containing protein n=1 Tax=unclassified Streptomyces TaxID=2593676 RepID=UPI003673CE91
MPHPQPQTVAELTDAVLSGAYGPDPKDLAVTSAFWLYHTTRLAGSEVTYHNHYLVLRVGHSFGACSFEAGELAPDFCENASGHTLDTLLRHDATPVRVAALDAYLSQAQPHREADGAEPVALPGGTPEVRARARDASIAGLLDIEPGTKVALIGVVNPLVAAIRERGGVCLPCDLNLRTTQWGEQVADDMTEVLREADAVVATGMTLSNGTFDLILEHCREQGVPLVVYAQTGSAVARAFLSGGVTALNAEPFPFSQFSADPTLMYRYRAGVPTRERVDGS